MALSSLAALDPRLCAVFGAVYTVPGWVMVLATRGVRAKLGPGEDGSATQVVRLTNRTIASTSMYVVPLLLVLANLHVWSPWTGGQWDSPLDDTQRALLHMQLMYYLVDMPYTLLKRDVEQVVHHAIGLGLALPTVQLNKCGLVMCSVLFTEQARAPRLPKPVRRGSSCRRRANSAGVARRGHMCTPPCGGKAVRPPSGPRRLYPPLPTFAPSQPH